MKKIIITGGLGYIGMEIARLYSAKSRIYDITVIDNRLSKKFISNGVERLGINISNPLDIEYLGQFVKSFGSSSASALVNISNKDIIQEKNNWVFNKNLLNKINKLYEKGVREIIFQDMQ